MCFSACYPRSSLSELVAFVLVASLICWPGHVIAAKEIKSKDLSLMRPKPLTPADSTIQSANDLVLTWTPVEGAAYYQVAIKIGAGGKWRYSKLLATAGAKVSSDAFGSIFYWKVKAVSADKAKVSRWSRTRIFMLREGCVKSIRPSFLQVPADPDKRSFIDSADYNITIIARESCNWRLSLPPDWIGLPHGRTGKGTDVIRVTVQDNTTFTGRSAILTVDGMKLTVSQSYGDIVNNWKLSLRCSEVTTEHSLQLLADGDALLDGIYSGYWISSAGAVSIDIRVGSKYSYYGGTAYSTRSMAGTVNCPDGSTGSWSAVVK